MSEDAATSLYYNATIHTVDEASPRAEAMLVRGDRLAAVGTTAAVEAAADRDTRRVDLEGKAVIPGFNDPHCHILSIGLNLSQIDVSADAVRTIPDIQRAIRERAARESPDAWLAGRGYDQNMLAELRHPRRQELDEGIGRRPAVLWHTSGHVLASNSRALDLAGIGPETPDPAGGEIERDEHGNPTGLLKESAMELIGRVMPPPSDQEAVEAIQRATELMSSYGITSATDASTGRGPSAERELDAYRRVAAGGKQQVRIGLLVQIGYVAPPDSDTIHRPEEFHAGDRQEWLRIAGTKIFSDGALSTRTAAMRVPYREDASNHGILLWEPETLTGMMRRAHDSGWQIATHALGDRAVAEVLSCYQQAMDGRPAGDRRHRIEHCMICDEGLARRIRELGIVLVLQPDIFRLGDGYIAALGLERAQEVIPMRLFERFELHVAFSSDAPVVPVDPLRNIRSAIARTTPAGMALGLQHSITVLEAIRLYTAAGAYATRTEHITGALRPGMLADFAVLSRDPAATPIEDFDSLHVTMTVAGGEVRYSC